MEKKIKNLDISETHDRLINFKDKNELNIQACIASLIAQDPFDGLSFYIFAHKRSADFPGEPDRLLWQPRLKKPKAQTNSMLFKVNPKNPEEVKIIWMIPDRKLWQSFQKGKMFESEIILDSIYDFENNREKLEMDEPDDLNDEQASALLKKLYPNLFKV